MRIVRPVFIISLLIASTSITPNASATAVLQASDPGNPNAVEFTTNNNNDLGLGSTSITVMVGEELDATGPGLLTFEYIGKEASWTNYVSFSSNAGGCDFDTATSIAHVSSCDDIINSAGKLTFSFSSDGTPATVANGDDFSLLTSSATFGLIKIDDLNWYILFDDGGGSGNDRDFDDLGMKVTFTPSADPTVPEPATITYDNFRTI